MASPYVGRKKPYTEKGISRAECFRCGRTAYHQWQICSNNNLFVPICMECDIELNRIVLEFIDFGQERTDELMRRYIQSQGEACSYCDGTGRCPECYGSQECNCDCHDNGRKKGCEICGCRRQTCTDCYSGECDVCGGLGRVQKA